MQSDYASAMSIDNSPGPSSLNTPLPSTHHLKPSNLVLTPICGNKTPRSLLDLYLCESLAVALTHPLSGPNFKIHTSKEKSYADKAWCVYCHKPFAREHSTLFRHIERNHKDQLKKEDSVVCSKKEKTILTAKKSQLEQYFTSQIPPLTKNEQDKAMKLLAHAWCKNLLPPVLADSLTFSE